MVFCKVCDADVVAEEDFSEGCSFCTQCGSVLEEANYVSAISFSAEGGMVGQMVTEGTAVFQNTMAMDGSGLYRNHTKGHVELSLLVDQLNIHPRDDTIEAAHRLYKLAVHRGFLRGRRTNLVSASCLYIICRQDRKPYLLIDFSDALQVNLYTLGIVYLDLCFLFRMEHHPIITSMVDPSLFIHRYADRLRFGDKTQAVIKTSLALIKSMKRDWIQTGRRPSGLCGAALLLASQIHGCPRGRKDIVHLVHVGVSTLTKRLEEFSSTTSGKLTPKEFEQKANEFDEDETYLLSKQAEDIQEKTTEGDQEEKKEEDKLPIDNRCHHIEKAGAKHHLHGMCRTCYLDYIKVSGGILPGTSNPPVLIKQEKKRKLELAKRQRAFLKESMRNGSDIDEDDYDIHPIDEVEHEMEHALQTETMRSISAKLPPVDSVPGVPPNLVSPTPEYTALLRRSKRRKVNKGSAANDLPLESSEEQPIPLRPSSSNLLTPEDPTLADLVALNSTSEYDSGSQDRCSGRAWSDRDRDNIDVEDSLDNGTLRETQDSDSHVARNRDDSIEGVGNIRNLEDGESVPEAVENGEIDETLSDINDEEVDGYIRTSEEAKQKEIWWNEMYSDYMAKEEAKKKQQELEKSEEPKKKRKWVRKKELRKRGSEAMTPLEATTLALENEGLTNKINYDKLKKLFDIPGGNGKNGKDTNSLPSSREAREQAEAEEQRHALRAERTRQNNSEFLRALSFRNNDPNFPKRPGRLTGLYT